LIGASNLVGRTVTYQDADGASQTGVVTSAKLNGDSGPTLKVGNTDVQLSKVTEVQQTAAAAAQATPTTASSAAPGSPSDSTPTA
jgi:flagellar basal-body rod modification protein FlgD